MPIYEYHCAACARSFETLVRAGHEEDAQCPSCNGVNLSRELSVFASGHIDGQAGSSAMPSVMPRGGCCGGSCGCH